MRVCLLLAFLLAGIVSGQTSAFEVATIKPAAFPSNDYFRGFATSGGCGKPTPRIEANRVALPIVTLCGLIRVAYDVQEYQIDGLPPAMSARVQENFYDVMGQVAAGEPVTPEGVRELMRTLLAERFGLRFHRETRELPVYALEVQRGGSKLSTEPLTTCQNGRPVMQQRGQGFGNCQPTYSTAQIAENLSREMDRPVIDRTGLTGKYAFFLVWTNGNPELGPRAAPGIVTAVQEQLGLRFEPTRAAIDVLIVEEVHRPTDN